MRTRPDQNDNNVHFTLSTPVRASKLRLSAASGDNMYSTSEIQAFGVPVPEPSACCAGIAALCLMLGTEARRFRK